jgi:hypothetical protein
VVPDGEEEVDVGGLPVAVGHRIAGFDDLVRIRTEIVTRREGPSCPAEDDHAAVRMAFLLQGVPQPIQHGAVERVQPIGPVEREPRDAFVALDEEFVSHRSRRAAGPAADA